MTRVDRQPGLVLHRRPFRETSLIIELLTLDFGRVGLVVRGARSVRSPVRGMTEPFRLLEVSWSRRGELGTVTGLEPAGRDPRPRLEGRALWCGLYANELLLKLFPRDVPEPELFSAYREMLGRLPDSGDQGRALRLFELQLLRSLGVAPDLARVGGTGEPVRAAQSYRVDPQAGPRPVSADDPESVPGRVLKALASGELTSGPDARHARLLMRRLLAHQLEGRVLHTPRLFRDF